MARLSVPSLKGSLPGYNAPGAGFEAPFEMLGACHDRVERMLRLIALLQTHLQTQGLDVQVRQAAQDVIRYFDLAAPHHHEDEERHVFPALMLGSDATVKALVLRLIQDHRQMETGWPGARAVLQTLIDNQDPSFKGLTVWQKVALNDFARLYRQHLDDEDKIAYPAAQALLKPAALREMSQDMMARRGVVKADLPSL